MDTISIFEELAKIPSPSLYEENVAKKIMEYTYNNGINAYFDDYKNVIIKIPANSEQQNLNLMCAGSYLYSINIVFTTIYIVFP